MEKLDTQVCIVGGGPAGMMAGLLLARAGVEVVVLEKHEDFLRDFRGDTIHPSTLELMYELGVLEEFLKRPHQEARQLQALVNEQRVTVADFAHIPTHCKFLALMPQWDFLDFLKGQGTKYPQFKLRMRTEMHTLIEENGQVVGVRAKGPEGELEIRSTLVLGTDGRRSRVREAAGLKVLELGAPMDVLWMHLSRKESDPPEMMGILNHGQIFVMLYRGDYWQCAYVIAKGGYEKVRGQGLESLQRSITKVAPFLTDRPLELKSWDQVKLLTVAVDRLERWYKPGLLCIGDAAHAMSPVGGVGINLAIQDAVAAANILAPILKVRIPTESDLKRVQQRRLFPTRVTQRIQLLAQRQVIGKVLAGTQSWLVTLVITLSRLMPFLRRIPARVVGVGVRPEHVRA